LLSDDPAAPQSGLAAPADIGPRRNDDAARATAGCQAEHLLRGKGSGA
jgi:hypothetical protein